MAKRRKSTQSEQVIQSIRKWMELSESRNDPNLIKLIQDIEADQNLKIWAEMNLETIITIPDSGRFLRQLRRINTLTNLRNILVFSPVALTWASISVVTDAFAEYEKENPNAIVNFLQFWQQGFGYLSDFWILSSVAIFDAALVLIVIVLTYLIGLLTQKNIEIERLKAIKNQEFRIQTIFEIQNYLFMYKFPTQAQINRNILSSSKTLEKGLGTLNRLIKKLEKDIARYPNSNTLAKEVKTLNKNLKKLK